MIFDFQGFINEMRNNENKRHIIENYEKVCGSLTGDYKERDFYKEYLSKFKPIKYKVPIELEPDFDYDLLLVLVVSSFSSEYDFVFTNGGFIGELPDLNISVCSGNIKVTKSVSELWSFQLIRLFEIYFEEIINLQALKVEDSNELNTIEKERNLRRENYNKLLAEISCFNNTSGWDFPDNTDKKQDFINDILNSFPE